VPETAVKTGLLVLGHGSQSEEADEIFAKIVDRVRGISSFEHVAMGSLQLSRPTFADGVQALLDEGVQEMVIMPMFIFRGNHVKFDIPEELENLRVEHPEIRFVMAEPIGADVRLADIIEERARDARQVLTGRA
jgi:sirohydrochlorin cobaltochelatase